MELAGSSGLLLGKNFPSGEKEMETKDGFWFAQNHFGRKRDPRVQGLTDLAVPPVGWGLPHLPCSVFCQEIPPDVQPESPLAQLEGVSSHFVTPSPNSWLAPDFIALP